MSLRFRLICPIAIILIAGLAVEGTIVYSNASRSVRTEMNSALRVKRSPGPRHHGPQPARERRAGDDPAADYRRRVGAHPRLQRARRLDSRCPRFRGGALGYVTKNAPPDQISEAIFRVAAGHKYIEPQIARELGLLTVRTSGRPSLLHPFTELTRRDLKILRLLGEGYSLLQIGGTIGLSYKTVAINCSQMKNKLGLARTADPIRIAIEHQISVQTRTE